MVDRWKCWMRNKKTIAYVSRAGVCYSFIGVKQRGTSGHIAPEDCRAEQFACCWSDAQATVLHCG